MNRKFIKDSNIILRKIFNSINSLDIISDFIETFLKIKIATININPKVTINGKESRDYGIVDVRVKTKDGEELNIGIQIVDGNYIQNKMLLYYAKIHSNQVFYGDNRKVAKTITINILDMKFFSGEQYEKTIKIKSNVIHDDIIETIELYILELPKYNFENKKRISNKEAWVMYLEGKNEKEIEKAKNKNKQINKLDGLIKQYWENEKI